MRKLHVATLRSMRTYFVGASAIALMAGCAATASAACTTGNPVDCTGTTVGKVTIGSTGTVNVTSGATLSAGVADDAALGVTSGSGAGTSATITVDGTVSGNRAGIVGNATAQNFNYPSTRLDITVGATGQIHGQSAIYLDAVSGGSGYRTVGATLDNSGLIQGSLYGLEARDGTSGFLSVTNEAGGVIRGNAGAIYASVATLTNAGLIDGGSGAAYGFSTVSGLSFIPSSVINSGTMTSNSLLGTIYLTGGSPTITNSGTIADTNGAAIDATTYLGLTNTAGGVIESNPSTAYAVVASAGANIVNQGAIDGGVEITGTAGSVSVLTNLTGTINGQVSFGAGDDTLNVSWDASANRIAGISGPISGGGGTNTLRFDLSQNATLDGMFSHLVMPTNFQKLGVLMDTGVTATLNGEAPDGLQIGGNGNFITTGNVTSTGAAFTQTLGPPYDNTSAIGFTNSGDIRSVFSPAGGVIQYNDYAVQLLATRSFTNSGTITSVGGNGVSVVLGTQSGSSNGTFANSGSIVADGTALNLVVNGGTATNTGAIRSTGGIGLSLGASNGTFVNSGTISGATTGATIGSGTLVNSGTITGTTTGVQASGTLSNSGAIIATNGVGVTSYFGNVNNLAGGVITGSGDAIENTYGGIIVTNAGTINGNVNFALAPSYYYTQGNVFVDQGGTINGSLLFGSGADTYVTDISKFANGQFTNVSGTVDGGGGQDTLVLRVGSDATARLASATNFERTQYDLSNGAKLTLGADATVTGTLVLAGTGSVDLTANFNVADTQALVVGTAYGAGYSDPAALSIVSHGNMTFAETTGYSYIGIGLANTTTFKNAGNITVTSAYLTSPPPAAITGGAQVTNAGTITLTNAAGVLNALDVVNTGSIVQAANAQTSYGVSGINSLENSGTIQTGGAAVTLDYINYAQTVAAPSVTNSGLIRSTGADAIDQYYSTATGGLTLTNTATGQVISDMGLAISAGNGYADVIHNDGLISGGINLYYGNDLLVNHGTISGTVDMGDGDDTVMLTGGTVLGSVAGGAGYDRLQLDVTDANAPVLALGTTSYTGFEELDMQAGTATMGGTYGFNTVQVSGGHLIGLAGSSLTAQTITVASGATLGSAGTVNGNLTVNGTLDAGASLGTMTVNGNINLAKGSTSLFTVSPTLATRLQVRGSVAIADGSTLQFAAGSKVLPGQKFDLIDTTGGITGKYATLSGAPANLYLIQSTDTLQGLGLFTASQAFPSQVSNTIATFNAALINGTLGASLNAALPALFDPNTGNSDPNALLRLTPQAYASASQLATEDALSVIGALRDESHFVEGASGGFAFGRAVSAARKMTGDTVVGVAGGRLTDSGVLSGMGYAAKSAWISAFGGYLDGLERLPGLEAHTTTHSLVLGAQGQVQAGAFRLGLLAAYDRGDANTQRTAPGDIGADGRYALKSWLTNIDVAYRAPLNADWAVEPRLAASYVRTVRDGATEQGGGVFALTVDEGRSANWFVDGHVEFDGGQRVGQTVHPFVSVGFVTRSNGQANAASASLNGLPVSLTVDGLDLAGTRAAIGAGVRYDLSGCLKASVGYDGEFGKNGRQSLDLDLHWAF